MTFLVNSSVRPKARKLYGTIEISSIILLIFVSEESLRTFITTEPSSTTVPANTLAPALFMTARGSPVMEASFM